MTDLRRAMEMCYISPNATVQVTPLLPRRPLISPYDLPNLKCTKSVKKDSYPGNDGSARSDHSYNEEYKPLLRVNNPEPSVSSCDARLSRQPRRKKKRVHFSDDETDPPPLARGSLLPSKDYDSLDYDICYNVPYKEMIRKYKRRTYIHMEIMRWVLVGFIGVFTGVVAFGIDICVKNLFHLKFSLFEKLFNKTEHSGEIIFGFLVLLGFNVLFAIVASVLVAFEPVAAGSGIPEIKCYLNGVKIPHVTRVGTLIPKDVGVLFSVAGGFFVGKEGPMIHSGAIIGAGLPQFRSMLFRCIKLPYSYFRSDRDKRDFVSSGAAAGVAAAFGAPIGGVLFSLEEGSSFWNQALTWRTLFCSFCATFTLNLFLSLSEGDKFGYLKLGSPGLVDFGTFGIDENKLWNAYHLIIFMLMGAVGGLLGALFNSLNINLSKYRMKYLHRRQCRGFWRVLEAVLIVMVTTVCIFLTATLLGTCVQERADDGEEKNCPGLTGDLTFRNETRGYFCPNSVPPYYNDMATLVFNSQETAIKQLFHQSGAFSLPTLWIIFLMYFFVACWTYGAGIPSGLFIPCLMIGSAYGRFVATVFGYLTTWKPHLFHFLSNVYPGTYALIGAASFLGGVVRMTISLTVILIESTNEISYGLPIMLTLMVAKWVGDLFNHGLYDHHIDLKSTPFLGWESPERMDRLIAADVMSSNNLCYVYPITRVRSVETLLRTTAYSAFLVVTPVEPEFVPERPKNVQETHTPQLYISSPTLGEWTATEGETDQEVERHRGHNRELSAAELKRREAEMMEGGRSRWATMSYTLPGEISHSQIMGTRAPNYTDERERSAAVIITNDDGGIGRKLLMFHGIILRSQLIELLKHRVFFEESMGPESQKKITHDQLTSDYPRYPNVFKAIKGLSERDRNKLMDLSLYMNPCPYTISHEAPLPQVFNLFRTMGLRHLPVMQESGIVVGIITRHDLTHENLCEKWYEKKAIARAQRKQRNSLDINDGASMSFSRTLEHEGDDEVFQA